MKEDQVGVNILLLERNEGRMREKPEGSKRYLKPNVESKEKGECDKKIDEEEEQNEEYSRKEQHEKEDYDFRGKYSEGRGALQRRGMQHEQWR